MLKTTARRLMTGQAQYGYFAHGGMEAQLRCPVCQELVRGYLPKYAKTYDGGVTYRDRMVEHLMEEH